MKTINLILIACFLFGLNVQSQEVIEARLENWEYGEADLGVIDFITGEAQKFGSIDEDGNIQIKLESNFLQKMKEQMEKEQEKAPKGWKAALKNVSGTFDCFLDDLTYTNGEANLSSLPKHLVVYRDKEEILGGLMAASNKPIANYYYSAGELNCKTGKYLEWTYLEKPAMVKGTCTTKNFTRIEGESFEAKRDYSLDLKEGWNLIEYNITEVFEGATGKVQPKTTKIQRIENIPSNVNWYFVQGQ
ncbi:MAG TPA: hypothetical protein VJ899_12890 [Salegentibacter sp.]|nr:hypothetical protein [Salegentibacter sp.]